MQQIADWLNKLGMSEYADRFAENRIDFSVLPDLTDQDLEKLGVVLGDRRKMLRAIAKLDDTSAAPLSVPSPAPKGAVSTAPLTTGHLWNDGRKLHGRHVAKVGRTTRDPERHWLVVGDYQTLYAAQQAVEKHIIGEGDRLHSVPKFGSDG
jgi:SAM domain (Sterile alpha motif)